MRQPLLHRLALPLLGFLLFATALWVLHRELQEYHYRDIIHHVEGLSASRLCFAFFLTVLSYLLLTGYDTLALCYCRRALAYRKIAFAAFISYAFSHNIGLSVLTSGSIRYRFYSAWGLSTVEIANVVAFCSLTFWLGFLAVGGAVFLLTSVTLPAAAPLSFLPVRLLGLSFLILVGGYLVLSQVRKKPLLKIREWKLRVPTPRVSVAQVCLSSLDLSVAAGVLYVLLPPAAGLSYPKFLGIFLLAQILGLLSQVPGGLGIFETIMLLFLSSFMPGSAILGALLAYRGIYYLFPLTVAATLLGIREVHERKDSVRRLAHIIGRWDTTLVPPVLAFTTFLSGAILLFSGATPAAPDRLAWLTSVLPLPVIETSHFLGSLVGMGLLLLAWGLYRRLDSAYVLSTLLLGAGIVLSLLKGLDYEEALILSIMLGALLPCRQHFYRQTSLFSARFTPEWSVAIASVVLGSLWLGIFSHKQVEYSRDVWWLLVVSGEVPRFLRTTVGVLGTTLFLVVLRLFRPAPPEPTLPGQSELDRARAIVATVPNTAPYLALLGDKTFLFSENDRAFIMYSVAGRSWIALGDPIGPPEERTELVWRFRELSDRHAGWPVFYQVHAATLPLYLDLGLTLLKLGEEGHVCLDTFSLEGKAHRGPRLIYNRLEKQGCSFEVIPIERIPFVLPELQAVSDAWLAEKKAREKGFSLGRFQPDYIQQFPAGVVRKDGKILAFANLWLSAEKTELSPDLMRFRPEAPDDIMEYLFLHLMLWGKQKGYRRFSLGITPLAGLENRALAPLWNRVGALVFHHGEHFYNFRGLRQYKEKFDPSWEPIYLAAPGGLALPRVLTNLATLISGGLGGIVMK